MRAVLLSLLFVAISIAATMPALAVDDESGMGSVIEFTVQVRPGSGGVFVSTDPLIGVDTQFSERTAVRVAMQRVGVNQANYDVFLTMSGGARSVDGPSAGVVMTLLTVSELSGRQVRGDLAATGTIEPDGSIGSVGGVPAKVQAAAGAGKKIVLVPVEGNALDKVRLISVQQRAGVQVVEVANIAEAEAIAFSPVGSVVIGERHGPSPYPEFQDYSYECAGCHLDKFASVAQAMVDENTERVRAAEAGGRPEYASVTPILDKETSNSQNAMRHGYYYTAANIAFLNLVDVKGLVNANITRTDLGLYLSEVDNCTLNLQRPNLTVENRDFMIGGDLRLVWAKKKLAEVHRSELQIRNGDDMLLVYRDAAYVMQWCQVAGDLYEKAGEIGGSRVDEILLEEAARRKVISANETISNFPNSDSDSVDYLNSSMMAYDMGYYGAAIYGADYALASIDVLNMSGTNESKLLELSSTLANRKGRSLWGALFLAHTNFYYQVSGGNDVFTILRLGTIADRLDGDSEEVAGILSSPRQQVSPEPSPGLSVVASPSPSSSGSPVASQSPSPSASPSTFPAVDQKLLVACGAVLLVLFGTSVTLNVYLLLRRRK